MNSLKDELENIKKQFEKDRSNPLRIAMFGQPGAGKSSLINAILGREAAKVGARTDETPNAACFRWKDEVEIWDLPGYGTSKFPADSYIKRFNVRDYDMFLCVFDGKFTSDDDAMFFEEVRAGNRPCILVSNKCDALWEPGKTDEQIRAVIQEDVLARAGKDAHLIFTSARTNEGLGALQAAIHDNLEPARRGRFAFAAKAYTKKALEQKRDAAKDKITLYAGLAAANALNPVPGADIAVDLTVLVRCFTEIREAYGLTPEMLKDPEAVVIAGPVVNRLLAMFTAEGLLALLKRFAGRQVTKAVAKYIPFVGQAIAASAGFAIVKLAGDSYVDDCHEVAAAFMEQTFGVRGAAE